MNEANIFELIGSVVKPGGWVVLAFVVFAILKYTENVFLIASKFQKLFVWAGSNVRKKTIANDIRGRVLKASKRLTKEKSGLLPYDLKIVWVKDEDRQTFLDNNEIIVRMRNSADPTVNYIHAITEYVKSGLIPGSKKYLDENLLLATNLSVIRKLLLFGGTTAVNYFDENVYNKEVSRDVRSIMGMLRSIDDNGMFIQVLLNEFEKLAVKLNDVLPCQEISKEAFEFTRFLFNIASRKKGDKTKLRFVGNLIKVNICLAVGEGYYSWNDGNAKYREDIDNSYRYGIDTVYIYGMGSKTDAAREIADYVKEHSDFVFDYTIYPHMHISGLRKINAVCVELLITSSENSVSKKLG
ncbi:MAG: hypothetical protein LBK57_00080 [Clostridiales Family XIII bacterium]|jgi:hypothetical protein|nr:hypothetical protein [Clostridiales Family XIII bacterium]